MMQAVILAAGLGHRLGDVVRHVPKAMIAIEGKPVLEHNILQLRAAGIREIVIHTHHLHDVICSHFGDGSRHGVAIRYHYAERLPGTAGAVGSLQPQISESRFCVIYGDSYSNFDLNELIRAHDSARQQNEQIVGTIGLFLREDKLPYGVVDIGAKGRVLRIAEKPSIRNLVNTGHYVLERSVFDLIPDNKPSDFAVDIFPRLVEQGILHGVELNGWLMPYDTPELLALARQRAAEKAANHGRELP